jgi:hypothetical protein
MDKAYQFTAGELYSFQVMAAQAYSDMMLPDISQITEKSIQDKQTLQDKAIVAAKNIGP